MQAEIIVFSNTSQPRSEQLGLDPFNYDLINTIKENHSDALCLIEDIWLPELEKNTAGFEFRGEKHPSKPLTYYFSRENKKIFFVHGCNYRLFSQLKRSIKDFLNNASQFAFHSVYFIAVSKELFVIAKEEASQTYTNKEAKKGRYKNPILDLITPVSTRVDLKKSYIGSTESCILVRNMIGIAAQNDLPVLVLGETGTGKEIVAWNIHECSKRKSSNFISVNCGAIPSDLFESELFGYKKGAFTGALKDKKGLWEVADGGTLFLDEIGDLALHNQVKILKALDNKWIMPVGGLDKVKVDVRIIAATNKNIEALASEKKGEFRDDLFYRISTFIIRTPALSSHTEDIPEIAAHIWSKLCDRKLSEGVLNQLRCINWPGNVRSLKHFLQRLNALFETVQITEEHIQVLHRQDQESYLNPDNRKPVGDKDFEKAIMKIEYLLKASLYCEDEDKRRELLENAKESLEEIG
jgi:transcriptional regulator with PAS, ATPase and Fis domain